MVIIVAPATTMDFETAVPEIPASMPCFLDQAATLAAILRPYAPVALAELMSLSDDLAALNHARFQAWTAAAHATAAAKPALFAFRGDTYRGLNADTLTLAQLAYAQRHLRIVTGLYGLLRPFDRILPYRLEMKTKVSTDAGDSLYAFWGDGITHALNEALAESGSDTLVNLASNEYARAVNRRQLNGRFLNVAFKEKKGDAYRVIGFFAKEARGRLSRFIIENEITTAAALRTFDWDGYTWNEALSTAESLVFTR